jgi:hypothetical protein
MVLAEVAIAALFLATLGCSGRSADVGANGVLSQAPAGEPSPVEPSEAPASNQGKSNTTEKSPSPAASSAGPAKDNPAAQGGLPGKSHGLPGRAPDDAADRQADDQEPPRAKQRLADEPAKPKAPNPACELCLGMGVVPRADRQRRVHVEGDKLPAGEDWVPWQYCKACWGYVDAKALAAEESRLWATTTARHEAWEKRLDRTLVCVRTPHVVIHAQMPKEDAAELANLTEDLVLHLQKATRSCVLTLNRHDKLGMVALTADGDYEKVLEGARGWKEFRHIKDWAFHRKLKSIWAQEVFGGSTVLAERTHWRDHCVGLFALGAFSDARGATPDADKGWLSAGFYYYCQQAILKRVRVGLVQYLETETPHDDDWKVASWQAMEEGSFRPWKDLFDFRIEAFSPPDHLECFSIVSYLIELDGPKFGKFVAATSRGTKRMEALEASYAKPVSQLEADWKAALTAEYAKADLLSPSKKRKATFSKEPKAAAGKKMDESPEEIGERRAADKLNQAKALLNAGKNDAAIRYLKEVISQFPQSKSATEAKELLKTASPSLEGVRRGPPQ